MRVVAEASLLLRVQVDAPRSSVASPGDSSTPVYVYVCVCVCVCVYMWVGGFARAHTRVYARAYKNPSFYYYLSLSRPAPPCLKPFQSPGLVSLSRST